MVGEDVVGEDVVGSVIPRRVGISSAQAPGPRYKNVILSKICTVLDILDRPRIFTRVLTTLICV